jgi:hypothetical protein
LLDNRRMLKGVGSFENDSEEKFHWGSLHWLNFVSLSILGRQQRIILLDQCRKLCSYSALFATKSTCLLVTKCSLHRATVKGRPSRDLTMSSHTHFAQSLLIVSTWMQHLSLSGNAIKKSPLLHASLLPCTVLADLDNDKAHCWKSLFHILFKVGYT